MGDRLLQFRDALDISELCLRANRVFAGTSTKTSKNISRFFLPTYFDQPSRRLGEEPDSREEHKQEDDLEGDRKSPAEGRSAAVDERQATVHS